MHRYAGVSSVIILYRTVKKKREELGLKYKKMYWLMRRGSALSINSKLMLYKQILNPVWTYGIQLWGCTKQSNIDIIQRFQTKYLGISLMHFGTSETPHSTGAFKWRWLRSKLESSLRSMKKCLSTTSTSKRPSCSTTVNWCKGLKERNLLSWCSEH